MSRPIQWIICTLLCIAQTSALAEDAGLIAFLGKQVPPIDQAPGHAGLVKFRSDLIAAMVRHDLKFVLSSAEPDIEGCGWKGIDGFRTFATEPAGWNSIRRSLQLGGIMSSPTMFRSNYVMVTFPPEADMTAYEVVVNHASVHEKPDIASLVVGRLRHDIVIPIEKKKQWQEIEYRPGKTGYALAADLEYPTGYSAGLELQRGKWRIKWIASYCD